VLFLDEVPEFGRQALESLRQPLEDGVVTVTRARGSVRFPARFQLVAASNPCPCGYWGDEAEPCLCSVPERRRYRQRLSGPLLDRLDLRLDLPRLGADEVLAHAPGEGSAAVAQRVAAARACMRRRQGALNAALPEADVRRHAQLGDEAQRLARELVARLRLSGRGYTRLLRVARTIADLSGTDRVDAGALAEAAAYRGAGSGA